MVGRPVKQERAERTRAALIQAAAKLFGEQGFSGTSVVKIADEAGLTLGAVYFHFRNKSELAREIVFRQPEWVVTPAPRRGCSASSTCPSPGPASCSTTPSSRPGPDWSGSRSSSTPRTRTPTASGPRSSWTTSWSPSAAWELRAYTDVQALSRLVVYACTGAQMHSFIETRRADLPERVVEFWQLLLLLPSQPPPPRSESSSRSAASRPE